MQIFWNFFSSQTFKLKELKKYNSSSERVRMAKYMYTWCIYAFRRFVYNLF